MNSSCAARPAAGLLRPERLADGWGTNMGIFLMLGVTACVLAAFRELLLLPDAPRRGWSNAEQAARGRREPRQC